MTSPIVAFMSISFTHHLTILTRSKDYHKRLFYTEYYASNNLEVETLERIIENRIVCHFNIAKFDYTNIILYICNV